MCLGVLESKEMLNKTKQKEREGLQQRGTVPRGRIILVINISSVRC
jgi:hypothetical protein